MILVFGYDRLGCSRVWAIEAISWAWDGFWLDDQHISPTPIGPREVRRIMFVGTDSIWTDQKLQLDDLSHGVGRITLVAGSGAG